MLCRREVQEKCWRGRRSVGGARGVSEVQESVEGGAGGILEGQEEGWRGRRSVGDAGGVLKEVQEEC